MKRHSHDLVSFKKELFQNKKIAQEYKRLEPEFEIIRMILQARKQKGITQQELAEKVGTKQSAIARLEAGRTNPSVGFLMKLASALDSKLEVRMEVIRTKC